MTKFGNYYLSEWININRFSFLFFSKNKVSVCIFTSNNIEISDSICSISISLILEFPILREINNIKFNSIEDGKSYIDNFLIKTSKLLAFQ